jgi:hypothetical protein
MFAVHCTTWDSTVLLSTSSIIALSNTAVGVVVTLECHCGEVHDVQTGAWIGSARAAA